jgi:hypothetical protein
MSRDPISEAAMREEKPDTASLKYADWKSRTTWPLKQDQRAREIKAREQALAVAADIRRPFGRRKSEPTAR